MNATTAPINTPVIERCWATIGVHGDHSCAQLELLRHCHNCKVYRERGRSIFDRPAIDEEINQAPTQPQQSQSPVLTQGIAENVLLFSLAETWLALPIRAVADVVRHTHATRIPHRNDGSLEGLVQVQGELCLCVALIEVLRLGKRGQVLADAEQSRLVVLRSNDEQRIAFRTSSVWGVEKLSYQAESSGRAIPSTISNELKECLRGIVPVQIQRHAAIGKLASKTAASMDAGQHVLKQPQAVAPKQVLLLNPVGLLRVLNGALYQ